jgi:hypothetical protein
MDDRQRRLRSLLAGYPDDGSPASSRMCGLAVSRLAVTGAGVILVRRIRTDSSWCVPATGWLPGWKVCG